MPAKPIGCGGRRAASNAPARPHIFWHADSFAPAARRGAAEPHGRIELVKRLVTERGISVLFTEHSMDVVFAFADRIVVLARGRVIADGDAESIRDNAQGRG